MILGVGVDLASIERIRKIYEKYPDRFLDRIFTEREISQFQSRGASAASLAARFAAKEAALKAIGCGIGPAALREVEVMALQGKQPTINLYGEASRLAAKKNITDINISMTHEFPFACAFAVAFNAAGWYS